MLGFKFDLSKLGTGANIKKNVAPAVAVAGRIGTGQNVGRAVADVYKAQPVKKAATIAQQFSLPAVNYTAPAVRSGSRADDRTKKEVKSTPGASATPERLDDGGDVLPYVAPESVSPYTGVLGYTDQYGNTVGIPVGGAAQYMDGDRTFTVTGANPADTMAAGSSLFMGQFGSGTKDMLAGIGEMFGAVGQGYGAGAAAAGAGLGNAIGGGTRDVTGAIGGQIVPLAIIGGVGLLAAYVLTPK